MTALLTPSSFIFDCTVFMILGHWIVVIIVGVIKYYVDTRDGGGLSIRW